MKILLSVPGDLRTVPMNQFAAEALSGLGCEVTVFNHGREGLTDRLVRQWSLPWFIARKDRAVLDLARVIKPDLFLTVFGMLHQADLIRELGRMGIRTACWWLNDPFRFEPSRRDFAQIGAFHRYFTNCRGILPDYVKAGVDNTRFLPVGVDPTIHRYEAAEPEHDVLFAGDWHPLRQQVLEQLAGEFRVALMGPWQSRKIASDSPLRKCLIHRGFFTPQEMAHAFNRAKVVFNLHTWYGRWNYGINPRLFETAGCGAFQLSDFKDEIPDLYAPDKEIVLYRDTAELPGLLRHWLPRAAERKAIGQAALTRSLAEHTYKHRMRALLTECGFPG